MTHRLFITVDSLGDGGADRLYRFADGPAPSWDSDGVYLEGLKRFPGSIAPEVDFRNGGASIGGLAFELIATSQIRALLYSQRRIQIDTLQAALTTGDTSITLQSTTLAGETIILGHEAIYLTSHGGSGVYTCVRGVLGTQAQPHGVGVRDYVSVFSASAGPVLRFRRVTFGYVHLDSATGYSAEVTLWAGLLTGISAPQPHLIRLDADGLLSLLSKRTINNSPWRGTQDASPGTTIVVGARGRGQETISTATLLGTFSGAGVPNGPTTGTTFAVDGKYMVTSKWETSARGATASPRNADLYAGSGGDTETEIKEIWEVYRCSGTSSGVLPLSSNLITCCLQILTTTRGGYNGNYDVGSDSFPRRGDIGLGIPQGWIDISAAEELRGRLGDLLDMDSLYVGWEGKPVKAMLWIQEHLAPFGVALVDDGGTLKFADFSDNATLTTTTLTEADIVPPPDAPPPQQQRRMDGAFDQVVAAYQFIPGQGTTVETFDDAVQKFLNRYGDSSTLQMNLEGVEDRARAEGIAIEMVQRWHQEIPQIDLTVLRTRDDIGLGDLVLLTHSKVYQPDGGVRSVSGAACIVTAKRLDLENGTIRLRLLYVGALYNRQGRVAPAGVVEAWTGGTKTLDIKEDRSDGGFQSTLLTATGYIRDDTPFLAGDTVELCNRDHSVIEGGLTLASVGTNQLVLTTTPSNTPVAGNLIKLASYSQATTSMRARFAWIADGNEQLGSGNDDAYEWTSR